jgi:tetratricopeptide (TPR) repeat protein
MRKNRLPASALSIIFSAAYLASCASAPTPIASIVVPPTAKLAGETEQKTPAPVTPSSIVTGPGTVLVVPSREQLRKNTQDSAALAYIEIGSPDSIRLAVERINADARGMTDENRILLAVSVELMKILYPLEKVTWTMPSVPDTGSYIGAISSARKGVYDYNTGSADFLSLVLPSLVLAVSDAAGEYYADAAVSLQEAAARNPRSVLPPYFLALLSLREGKKDVALRWFEKAWTVDASCYPAGVGYAHGLLDSGNAAGAYEVSLSLSERYPDALPMNILCANAAFAMRDWDQADPWILKVLKSDPSNTAFLLMRARILVERKDYLKATSLLDAFATRNRTDRDYLILKARVLREWNKNLVEVLALLKDAQQRYPDDIEVLIASANACYETGQTLNGLSGRDFVSAVLRKDPGNASALALLVSDCIGSSEWADAVRNAEALVKIAPQDSSKILLARAYLGAGQGARAVSLSRELYSRLGVLDDQVTGLYLRALVSTGDVKTADELVRGRLANAAPALRSVLLYYQSQIVADSDARLASLRSSLLADPRNIQSLFAMYEWYFGRKDYRKAQYYLKQVIALDSSNANYAKLQSKLDELLAR